MVDAKRVAHPGLENEVTDRGLKPSFPEEERDAGAPKANGVTHASKTETAPTPHSPSPPTSDQQAAQEWIKSHHQETPSDSEIEGLGKHCWPEWGPHWGGGWTAAWATWTKDIASRQKFLRDAVAQLAKVGPPKPYQPDEDAVFARKHVSELMDRKIAEAPARVVMKACSGCGVVRQLDPGVEMCYGCRGSGRGKLTPINTAQPVAGFYNRRNEHG